MMMMMMSEESTTSQLYKINSKQPVMSLSFRAPSLEEKSWLCSNKSTGQDVGYAPPPKDRVVMEREYRMEKKSCL